MATRSGDDARHDAPGSKHLYRRLDRLLERALGRGPAVDWVASFARDFAGDLGRDLAIADARVYREERGRWQPCSADGEPLPGPELDLAPFRARGLDERRPAWLTAAEAPRGAPLACVLVQERRARHALLLEFDARRPLDARAELLVEAVAAALSTRLLENRLGHVLREAAEIQRSLLPAAPPPLPGFALAARSLAAEDVGGDFYDFFPLDAPDEPASNLGLAIGDASGHGLPAALVARDVVVGLRMGVERELRPSFALEKLNRVVHGTSLSSRFVSLFYGELAADGYLVYYNAGHEPPLLLSGGREELLATGDVVIGPLADARYKPSVARLEPGAALLLYTDGIVERRDARGELFGLDRLREVARAARADGPEALLDRLFAAARDFGGGAEWDDDATAVAVVREG